MLLTEEVPGYWEQLEPIVEKGIAASRGMLSVAFIKEALETGYALAFIVTKEEEILSLFVVDKVNYATYTAIRVIFCAGKSMKDAYKFVGPIEAWAVLQGAVEIEGWCAPGMTRLAQRYGWVPTLTRVTRDLRRKLQ